MFSIRIQLWKAFVIIISFFLTGILISLAILLFTCKKLFHKNKVSQSMNMETIIEKKKIHEEIIKENETSLVNNENSRENCQDFLQQNNRTMCEMEKKIDYSDIKSKYWESINRRKSPKFKNFLHKSNKPFLGYNTTTVQERINSSLNDSKKIKYDKF